MVGRQALIKRPEQMERKNGTGVTFWAPLMCGGAERSSMEKFSFLIFPDISDSTLIRVSALLSPILYPVASIVMPPDLSLKFQPKPPSLSPSG